MKSLWILGDVYTIKIGGDETQGRYSVWKIEAIPNNGPPLHKHSMEDEAFYVLEGDFSFPYGSSKDTRASKGQFTYVPIGEFHTYKNIGSSPLEKFFQEIGIPIEDKTSFQPPQITPAVIENIVNVAAVRYGLEIKI
jgi:mannose-6-phosphate isomerase-like protein (cupin superfamily)